MYEAALKTGALRSPSVHSAAGAFLLPFGGVDVLLIDQLREAATRCMAQAGCDNDCRDGERVAFAAWLRITGRISDFLPGDGRPLFSIDSVLGDGSSAKLCELTRDSPS